MVGIETDTNALPVAFLHGEGITSRLIMAAVYTILETMQIAATVDSNTQPHLANFATLDQRIASALFGIDALGREADGPELLARVEDPFTTSRTERKVGMGIPFFKLACEQTGGTFKIESEPGKGTVLNFWFQHDHLDRPPMGKGG